jgi:hypothetical protein
MERFLARETNSWSKGERRRPFSKIAVLAHEAAIEAASLLTRWLRTHDPEAGKRFLTQLELFLRSLAGSDPDRFRATWVELKKDVSSAEFDAHCKGLAEDAYRRAPDPLKEWEAMLRAVLELIERVAAGDR